MHKGDYCVVMSKRELCIADREENEKALMKYRLRKSVPKEDWLFHYSTMAFLFSEIFFWFPFCLDM